MLEIIYQDEYLVAINKPNGLAVHRSKLVGNTDAFALQILRDQIGQKVYNVHRLDRKTSGVLLFALSSDIAKACQEQFINHYVLKKYLAIVRGFTPPLGEIDYALKNGREVFQDAVTSYKTLVQTEINIPFGKHQTSRYSLLEVTPKTGRMHQIRKHMAHIFHPIIGDRPHGCNKQNKLFKEKWNMTTMLLHAKSLEFTHPITNEKIVIEAGLNDEFKRTQEFLNLPIP